MDTDNDVATRRLADEERAGLRQACASRVIDKYLALAGIHEQRTRRGIDAAAGSAREVALTPSGRRILDF